MAGRKERLEFHPIPEYGEKMKFEDWNSAVRQGAFTDWDGTGYLATGKQESNRAIIPSDLDYRFHFPKWATHVVWYNK